MFYDIWYKCPTCGAEQIVWPHYQLDSPDYDGEPLTDFLFEDGMKEMMSKAKTCPRDRNCSVEASGFFVRIVKPLSSPGLSDKSRTN